MQLMKIKPYDNTFFKDGHGMGFGVNKWVPGRNMPFSSTFWGAIFAVLIRENDSLSRKFQWSKDGKHEQHKKHEQEFMNFLRRLRIGKVYLYDELHDLIYIPAPKDLFIGSGVVIGGTYQATGGQTSLCYPYYLKTPTESGVQRADGYYVSIKNFHRFYPSAQFSRKEFEKEEDIFVKQQKIGIFLDRVSGTVKESHLYQTEYTEFNDLKNARWSFLVEYRIDNEEGQEYLQVPKNGILRLGGDSKLATYQCISEESEENEKDREIIGQVRRFRSYQETPRLVEEKSRIKVVFTSEAIIDKEQKGFQENFEVLAIVNDKPSYVGGYDMWKGQEKEMRKAHPPGTVILLKCQKKIDDVSACLREALWLEKEHEHWHDKGFNEYVYVEVEEK